MADNKKIITDELLKLQTEKVLQVIADLTYEFVPFDDTEISDILEISDQEAMELSKIINDNVKSNTKIWSSNKTDSEIKGALIEANKYTDDLVANLSNIKLDIVDALPDSTTVDKSTIYILKDSSGGTNNTLNVWSDSSASFVEVGSLSVSMDDYYDKTAVDNLLADKANADEVVTPDDIITDITQATGTNVLAASTTVTELDKKFDKSGILSAISTTPSDEKVLSEKAMKTELDKMLLKTAISTSIGDTPSDEKVPSEKAVYDNTFMFKNVTNIDNTDGSWIAQFIRPTSDNGTFPSEYSDWYKVEQIKARDFLHQICTLHDSSNLRSTYIRGAWCNATLIENAKWSSWQKVLTDTDIASTIDSSSTDKQVPSAKAVYDSKYYNTFGLKCPLDQSPLDFVIENTTANMIIHFDSWGNSTAGRVAPWASYIGIKHRDTGDVSLIGINNLGVYRINTYADGTWSGWRTVCTTTVADVPTTTITPTFPSTITLVDGNQTIRYSVKNGWANVSVIMKIEAAPKLGWITISNDLPKPDKEINMASFGETAVNNVPIAFSMGRNGERALEIMIGAEITKPDWYNINFSYPVAE